MSESEFYLGFSLAPKIGATRFKQLLTYFKSAENAWNGTEHELRALGVGPKTFAVFDEFRKSVYIQDYRKTLERAEVWFIPQNSKEYPQSLHDLDNPPIGLFVKGNADLLQSQNMLSVVGARKMTSYGQTVTEKIVADVAARGVVIVSGLALGVDACAHEAALSVRGATIAILGCGVDCCYPQENSRLYRNILEQNGAIISEYPLSASPNKGSFPSRNRIIAALSQATLVTEAGEDSGSLITAARASELGRTIFAVPGPITSTQSQGTTQLLKKGARLVSTSDDLFDSLDAAPVVLKRHDWSTLEPSRREIMELLEDEPLSVDEIGNSLGKGVHQLLSVLSELEMLGYLQLSSSGKYSVK